MGGRAGCEHAAFHLPGRSGSESAVSEAEGVFAGLLLHAVDEGRDPCSGAAIACSLTTVTATVLALMPLVSSVRDRP